MSSALSSHSLSCLEQHGTECVSSVHRGALDDRCAILDLRCVMFSDLAALECFTDAGVALLIIPGPALSELTRTTKVLGEAMECDFQVCRVC
jgi:hypothetical protein